MLPNNLLTEDIIKLLDLEALPDEQKEQMLAKMMELLQKRLMLKVIDLLSEEDQKQLAGLGQVPAMILAFINTKIPNFEEVVKEEVLKLKEELIDLLPNTISTATLKF